jgi:hypothetical protein
LALGKELLCRVPEKNTRQTTWHSAKNRIPVVRQKGISLYLTSQSFYLNS